MDFILFLKALRYTTNDGQWKESAVRLTNTLVNIRAIINHFAPKVDQWAAANHLSSLTEEQVSHKFYILCSSTMNFMCSVVFINGYVFKQSLRVIRVYSFSFVVVKCTFKCLFLQVLEVVRGNYDTLTLKLQDNLDQYLRYEEKPKETAFFTQLVSY